MDVNGANITFAEADDKDAQQRRFDAVVVVGRRQPLVPAHPRRQLGDLLVKPTASLLPEEGALRSHRSVTDAHLQSISHPN